MARGATGDAAGSSAAAAAAAAAELGSGVAAPAPVPTWPRVRRAGHGAVAHALLLCFTALLALKLDGVVSLSWWVLFIPLWLFHAVAARCRFSLPAPSSTESGRQVPCHSIVATPLLVAFELLLCVYLEGSNGRGEPFVDLKLVFLPLLALEIITLVDNFRMCGALMPGHGETITDEAIWDRLPYFWVAISMVFLLAATSLMLLKLCAILSTICLLLQGTPSNAHFIPMRAIFLPIILLQVATVSFAVWRFFDRLLTKLQDGSISQGHISVSSKVDEIFMMIQSGSSYSTFCSYPPEVVKEMPKKVLVEEVQRLQLALEEQTEMANHSNQQFDRLKNERILCRICFERDICIVLLPCRHHILCESCSNKCTSCPICRLTIESRLYVYDAVMSSNPLCDAV
nr:unnamed protein product [Digitaria exilis]